MRFACLFIDSDGVGDVVRARVGGGGGGIRVDGKSPSACFGFSSKKMSNDTSKISRANVS